MHSSTCPGAKGFTTIARWHRSKAPTERRNIRCGRGPSANREAVAKVQEGENISRVSAAVECRKCFATRQNSAAGN